MLARFLALFLLAAPAFGALCPNPEAKHSIKKLLDAKMYKEHGFTSTFSVVCSGKAVTETPIYASANGKNLGAVPQAEDGTYQLTYFVKNAVAGPVQLEFFDKPITADATPAFSREVSFNFEQHTELPVSPRALLFFLCGYFFLTAYRKSEALE